MTVAGKVLVAMLTIFSVLQTIKGQDSCVGACFQSGPVGTGSCYCDDTCSQFGNCCPDFVQECTNSSKCENRCSAGYDSSLPCQCNDLCWYYGNCCDDYHENCLPGSCNDSGMCGERNTTTMTCQCDGDCTNQNDCCEDYFDACTTADSCKNLCGARYDGSRSCQCTDNCRDSGNCCDDIETTCPEVNEYSCVNQCGMKLDACSCQENCVDEKNCCTDYEASCNGGTSWVEDECTPDDEMVCPEGFDQAPVIMFSIDGFRNSYLYRHISPNLWKLASCGVHSPFTRSVYPTKTFPNHYTIATGLFPESHGIVSNSFFDHDIGEEFRLGAPNSGDPHWWGGQPIWVTASNQGLISASYFWVGSDVNITRYPDYYYNFDSSVPDEKRILQVLKWLDLPKEKRPSVIMAYIEDVDGAGHSNGPNGAEVDVEIEKADKTIGMLMDGLKARNLDRCVNLIILADHGMQDRSCDRVSYVDVYGVDMDTVYFNGGPVGTIGKSELPEEWDLFNAQDIKKKLQCKKLDAHFEAYLKEEYLPKRYHYAFNKRIDDVQLVLDDSWIVGGRTGSQTTCGGGTHGWDNEFKAMRAVFIAHGASFKRKYNTTEGFDNYEIYNMVCDMLDIAPAPNNGTRASLNHLLKNPKPYIYLSTGIESKVCSYSAENDLPADRKGCPSCLDEAKHNQRLDISSSKATEYQESHILVGTPEIYKSNDEDIDFCILSQQEYITAYDWKKRMPYFTSYVLDNRPRDMQIWSFCARADVRIPKEFSSSCTDFDGSRYRDITAGFLYPAVLSNDFKSDALILSNAIPVHEAFLPVWHQFANILHQWSIINDGIAVTVGPIFDYDFDGHADSDEVISDWMQQQNMSIPSIPVPTHIFAIITKCKDPKPEEDLRTCFSSPENVDVISFILPNFRELPCRYNEPIEVWVPHTIMEHVARVRDVELLTKIQFFPDWTTKEGIMQNTLVEGIRLRTRLPQFGSTWFEDLNPNFVPSPRPIQSTTDSGQRAMMTTFTIFTSIILTMLRVYLL